MTSLQPIQKDERRLQQETVIRITHMENNS